LNGESNVQPAGRVSVIDPISRAIDWTTEVLFRPFRIEKWFVLGFCAWLAMLGQGGGSGGSSRWNTDTDRAEIEHGLHQAWEWVLVHLVSILLIAGVLACVFLVIWLLLLWLSSRGKFMFLDGVVNNRAAVVEPWHQFRSAGNSLFVFRVVLGLVGLASVIAVLTFGTLVVWGGIEASEGEPLFILALVLVVVALIGLGIVFALVGLAINDFLVPLMYVRGCGVSAAWRELGRLFSNRPGAFILYVLIKIFLAIFVGIIAVMACCLTCCIVLLPYIGTVILLPIYVFLRAYSVYFLGQFGPQYSRFAKLGPRVDD